MSKKIICVVCPMGCDMTVEKNHCGELVVSGNTCKRGEKYGKEEFLHPCRLLTSSVKVSGSSRKMLPVRSTGHIPKELIMECMKILHDINIEAPVSYHRIIVENILGTGIDIEASMPLEREVLPCTRQTY